MVKIEILNPEEDLIPVVLPQDIASSSDYNLSTMEQPQNKGIHSTYKLTASAFFLHSLLR